MRSLFRTWLAFVLPVTFMNLTAQENLLPNSSFEYGKSIHDILIWNRMRDVPLVDNSDWQIDLTASFDGEKSLCGTSELLLSYENDGRTNEKHILSVYLKTDRPEGKCALSCSVYTNQEDLITRNQIFQLSPQWTQYRLVVNKPFGSTRRHGNIFGPLRIKLKPLDGCKVWLDAVYWGTGNDYQNDNLLEPVLAAEPESATVPFIDLSHLAPAKRKADATFVLTAKHSGKNLPLQAVMPFAPGAAGSNTRFELKRNGQSLPCQFTPLSVWPDGKSLQTVLAEFNSDAQAGETQEFTLTYSPGPSERLPALAKVENNLITVRLGTNLLMYVKPDSPNLWEKVCTEDGRELLGPGALQGKDLAGNRYTANNGQVAIERNGPISAVITRSGTMLNDKGSSLGRYSVRLYYRNHGNAFNLELNISNNSLKQDFLLRELYWQTELSGPERQLRGPLGEFPAAAEGKILLLGDSQQKSFSLKQFAGNESIAAAETIQPVYLSSGDFRVQLLNAVKYYPAMLSAQKQGRLVRGYFWPAEPVKSLSLWRGLSASREFRLEFAPENSPQYFAEPAVVLPSPEDFSQSGIMIALAAQDNEKFPLFEQIMNTDAALQRCHPDSIAANFQYGLFDYGDHFGDGGWANLESYEDYSLFHRALRAGSAEIFVSACAAARHYRDIDTNQNHFLPITHSANHVIGGVGFGHAWVQGICSDYLLTGNLRSREVAWRVAEAIKNMPLDSSSIATGRNFGFYLLTLANCYGVFNDPTFVERFRQQLQYQIDKFAVPPTEAEMRMQRSDYPRQGSLFYTSYSGLVPFHCWYGLLGMELMYEFTQDPFILKVLKEQLPNIMNLEMTYRPQIETNWPGLPAEQALPTIATDYLYGRGALFYPVMVKYAKITGEKYWQELALDAAYTGLLGGRRKCGLQDIFMASALLDLPEQFSEKEQVAKIQNLLWQAASPALLNGDFSQWLPYSDLVIPKDGLGKPRYPEWAVQKPYPRNWHFVEGKQVISSMFMRFRPEYYEVETDDYGLTQPALRLQMEQQKWYLKSQDLISAKVRLEPGDWLCKINFKSENKLASLRFAVCLNDMELSQGKLEARISESPELTSKDISLENARIECSEMGKPGWQQARIYFSLPKRHLGWLKINARIDPEAPHSSLLLDDIQLEKIVLE